MELINLIGDTHENFYQLGLLDKNGAKEVHQDVKRMLSTPWTALNRGIEEVAKAVLKKSLLKKTDYYTHLNSYSEGLGISVEEAAYVMLIPELVSCMSKWAPGLIKGNLGCSSFFMRNEKQEVVHGRILDFPLQGSYDQFERCVSYDLKGMPKMIGFGSVGIPYPSITLMSEDGMTLALHQKFTDVFNKNGLSIFEYIFDLMKKARDKNAVIDYIKTHQSITTWCLYMSFKNGDVLGADIMGENHFINEYHVSENDILYFANHLENKNINQELFLPTGFNQYNLMREEIAQKKIKSFLSKKDRSDTELIKMMASPLDQKIKIPGHYEDYRMDNLTPSSLSIMTMNPSANRALYLTGPAPKAYQDNITLIDNCFISPELKELRSKKKEKTTTKDYVCGLSALMKAQKGFDLRDPQVIYHELQFAIDHFEHSLEKGPAHFYFLVAQYMYETHPKVLLTLLNDFKKLEGHLPQSLNDHCLLFINRLERITDSAKTLELDKMIHPKLKDIYQFENKIPKALLHLSTKNMMIPRIDIMDIIYVYTA